MIDSTLPLCELHRHLDGSIRLETILELADQHAIALPANDVAGLAPYVHIDHSEPGLMAFIARFKYLVEILADTDACRRVAYESVVDAHQEGIDYIELRFSPWFMAERHSLNPQGVVEACLDGVKYQVLDQDISIFTQRLQLLQSAEATSHPGCENNQCQSLVTFHCQATS